MATNKLIDLSRLSRFWDKVKAIIGDLSDLMTADKSSIVGAINEIAAYTPVYGNTASGAIATFDTSLALPLQNLQIAINAVQESGTPTPSSPKAISGFTGANISIGDNTNIVGGSIANASISASGQIVSNASYTMWYAPITQGKSYILTTSETSLVYGIFTSIPVMGSTAYNATQVISSKFTFIAPVSGYIAFRSSSSFTNAIVTENNVTPISWQSEAGTVYGGSLDVTSGVLTVTHGFKTYTGASDENWSFEMAAGGTQKNFYIAVSDAKRPQTAQNSTMICNVSPISNTSSAVQDTCFISNGRNFNFTWGNTLNISSASDFKTWLGSNNIQVCYELETPVTYQLTPTQISAIVGTNNVFTDTNGDTSVVYACSLKDYIDSQ